MFNDEYKLSTRQISQEIWHEGWPFVFNRAAEIGTDFWTMSMLSQVDSDHQSAASLIMSCIIIIRSVNATLLYFTGPLTRSELNLVEKGNILRKGWLFSLPLSAAGLGLALTSQYTLPIFNLPTKSIEITQNFLYWYAPSLCFTLPAIATQQWNLGIGRPKTVLVMTLLNAPLILLISYLLLPTYQEAAVGLSYTAAAISHFCSYLLLFRCKNSEFGDYQIFNFTNFFKIDEALRQLVRMGKWIGFYAGLELGSVTFATFLIGQFGKDALQSFQPSLQYGSVLANLTFALANSVAILVKGKINQPHLAKRFGDIGASMCFIFVAGVFITFLSTNNLLLKPFLGNDATQEVETLAYNFMLINLSGQLADSLRNAFTGGLRGLGNTGFASKINAGTVVLINIPVSLLSKFAFHLGALSILPPRVFSIGVSAALIWNKWRQEINTLKQQEEENKIEGPWQVFNYQAEKRGCLGRIWARFFNCRKPPLSSQIQLSQAETYTL